MLNQFSRTSLLLGKAGMEKLTESKVAIFGVGGVGGYTAEALARSGIGTIHVYDDDKICLTNLNRQLHATRKTIGKYKVDAVCERILEINPEAKVQGFRMFYGPDVSSEVDLSQYDYIVDAVDTVTAKLLLVQKANEASVAIISSMGAGNKMDATAFCVSDIYKTSVCPLAKVMRHELRKRRIPRLKVVYSKELPITPIDEDTANSCKHNCVCPPGTERKCTDRRQIPGSNAFVPSAVGLIIAGEVVKDLIGYGK